MHITSTLLPFTLGFVFGAVAGATAMAILIIKSKNKKTSSTKTSSEKTSSITMSADGLIVAIADYEQRKNTLEKYYHSKFLKLTA